jgi:hypothetical protein
LTNKTEKDKEEAVIKLINKIYKDYQITKEELEEGKEAILEKFKEILGESSKLFKDLKDSLGQLTQNKLKNEVWGGLISSLDVSLYDTTEEKDWSKVWEDTSKYGWNTGIDKNGKTTYPIFYRIDPTFFMTALVATVFPDRVEKINYLNNAIETWNTLVETPEQFKLTTQGDLRTKGCIVSGGLKSGENIWTLNARATSWKIKYGNSTDHSRFFGVALPFDAEAWNNGIRLNANKKSVLLNGNGIRFFNWDVTETIDNDNGTTSNIYGWKH